MSIYNAYRERTRLPGLVDDKAAFWTPQSIPNLQQWLKADAITGKVDGDKISQWDDSSGNGNHATQGAGANQPLYKTNRLNNLPAVYISGGSMSMTAGYNPSNPYTLFLLYIRRNGGRRTIQGSNNWLVGPYNGTHAIYNGGWVGAGAAVGTDVSVYTTLTSEAGASTMRQNGVAKGGSGTDGIPGTLYMGSDGAYPAEVATCDIMEMLIYSRVVTALEIATIEAYIKAKYAL